MRNSIRRNERETADRAGENVTSTIRCSLWKTANPQPHNVNVECMQNDSERAFEIKRMLPMLTYVRPFVCTIVVATVLIVSSCTQSANQFVPPPPPEVDVSLPIEMEVTDYLEATGTTAALESVELRSRVRGYLQKIRFKPGSEVKTGDVLFLIDPRPFEARVEEAEATLRGKEAALELEEIRLKKTEHLYEKAAVSELQTIEQRAVRDLAKAHVASAKASLDAAKLDLSFTKIVAPINGHVSRNLIDVGNLVSANDTVLTRIENDASVYVYFSLSESEVIEALRRLSKEKRNSSDGPEIPLYLSLSDEPDYPHKGKADFADVRVDPKTGTLQVRGIVPNDNQLLLPGMFVRVRVPIIKRKALLMSELAVQADQGGSFVLVVDKEDRVKKVRVKTGQTVKAMQVIQEGLSGKERVVVNGLQRARPGAKVKPNKVVQESTRPDTKPDTKPETKKKL
jgi:multidrug efflux system membrane fusion protein